MILLLELYLPPKVTHIEKYAFAKTPLKTIELNDGLIIIGRYAFRGESPSFDFEKIRIPASVKEIEEGAFYKRYGLREIIIEGARKIGECAFAQSNPEKLEFPDSLEHIEAGAFLYTHPKTIDFRNVKYIGKSAFAIPQGDKSQCELAVLNIPKTVEYIGEYAFENQGALKDVEFLGDTTEIMNSAFNGTPYGESRSANRRNDGEEH